MSLYEKIMKTIDMMKNIESDAAAIETLYFELKQSLRDRGIYFMAHDIQAIEIYRDDEYIVIEFYLNTIEIWIKIYRDGYIDTNIYPIHRCECG